MTIGSILNQLQSDPIAVASQFSGLSNVNNNILQTAIGLGNNLIKKTSTTSSQQDPFTLSSFQAQLKFDGQRLAKQYYYNVHLYVNNGAGATPDVMKTLTFNCNSVTLPGWKAKTQTGKIYGLSYEIATELEQDPVWMTFNVDITHAIENFFLLNQKIAIFDNNNFSPDYKENYQFAALIEVTDENFAPMFQYVLNNSMFRTVQQVTYGSGSLENQHITVELIYESISVTNIMSTRKKAIQGIHGGNTNAVQVGPFSLNLSQIDTNATLKSQVPSWFNAPSPL